MGGVDHRLFMEVPGGLVPVVLEALAVSAVVAADRLAAEELPAGGSRFFQELFLASLAKNRKDV